MPMFPVSEEVPCEDACAAFILTGRSSAAVLSAKRAAASCARPAGSTAAGAFVLAAYVGSTKTKSVEDGGSGFALAALAVVFGITESVAACGGVFEITSLLASAFTSMTRGAAEGVTFAVAAATSGAALADRALVAPVCSVNTSLPSADGVNS